MVPRGREAVVKGDGFGTYLGDHSGDVNIGVDDGGVVTAKL